MPERSGVFARLTISASLIVSGVACGANIPTEQSGLVQPAADTLSPEQAQRNAHVIETLRALPDSAVKSALFDRAVPYLEMKNDADISFGHTSLRFEPTRIYIAQSQDPTFLIKGEFKERGESGTANRPQYPIEASVIQFPVANLLTHEETAGLNDHLTPDGVPLVLVEFAPGIPIYDQFSPQIIITVGPLLDLTSEQGKTLFDFVLIKEVTQLLLLDAETRNIVEIMERNHLPMTVLNEDGQEVSTIAQAKLTITENRGRSLAAYDIAGHVVAIQAVAQDPAYLKVLRQDQIIGPLVDEILAIDLGETPEEMLVNSLRWAITSPNARSLIYNGDMNVFPN